MNLVQIEGKNKKLVSMRQIHGSIGVDSRYNDWAPRVIKKWEFVPEKDFYSNLSKNNPGRGRKQIDHFLGMECAIMVASSENTAKSREFAKAIGVKMAALTDGQMKSLSVSYALGGDKAKEDKIERLEEENRLLYKEVETAWRAYGRAKGH